MEINLGTTELHDITHDSNKLIHIRTIINTLNKKETLIVYLKSFVIGYLVFFIHGCTRVQTLHWT